MIRGIRWAIAAVRSILRHVSSVLDDIRDGARL